MSASIEENEALDAKYKGMAIEEVIRHFGNLRACKENLEDEVKALNKEFDYVRLSLIPKIFDEKGISKLTITGVGRVNLTGDLYASIQPDKQDEAFQFFRDLDKGALIKETINSSTLKATLKAMMQAGEEIPEDIFKVTPFTRASLTKV